MGIISIENTDRLYWLGRYSERTYTTIRLFANSFDAMIDSVKGGHETFCKRLDIPNIYQDGEDFIRCYCFDPEDPNSIISNLTRAYDNAILLREALGSEVISYIQLAVYAMNKAGSSVSPLVELQEVCDDILAFWGIVDDAVDSENVRNIIKIGKRIERLDLYGRLHMSKTEMLREVHRLKGRLPKTCLKYRAASLDEIEALAEADEIDYYGIVKRVENLLDTGGSDSV